MFNKPLLHSYAARLHCNRVELSTKRAIRAPSRAIHLGLGYFRVSKRKLVAVFEVCQKELANLQYRWFGGKTRISSKPSFPAEKRGSGD